MSVTTDSVKIPNQATYSPLPLADVFMLAPLASRLLFRASVPGRIVQALALGAYAGSALSDWLARKEARPIDFEEAFGQDPSDLEAMSEEARRDEVALAVPRSAVHIVSGATSRHKRLTVDGIPTADAQFSLLNAAGT